MVTPARFCVSATDIKAALSSELTAASGNRAVSWTPYFIFPVVSSSAANLLDAKTLGSFLRIRASVFLKSSRRTPPTRVAEESESGSDLLDEMGWVALSISSCDEGVTEAGLALPIRAAPPVAITPAGKQEITVLPIPAVALVAATVV